jgi:transcription initiation factor TFIIIB Brf1 subunit/transcription initiation factor TFIIB
MRLERCGAPVSELYPCGNGAYMVAKNAAARRVVRMQTWGNVSYAKRHLCKALSALSSEAHQMGLCEAITTRAKHMYNEVSKAPHMHGTRRAGLVQGCIYAALQTEGGARSVSEMPKVDHLAFGIKQVMRVIPVRPADPCTARAYVARRMDALRACGPGADTALAAAGLLDGLGIGIRATPPTKAAACALMTMTDADASAVCEVMGCSRGAAARCMFRLKEYREELVRAATAECPCSAGCGS